MGPNQEAIFGCSGNMLTHHEWDASRDGLVPHLLQSHVWVFAAALLSLQWSAPGCDLLARVCMEQVLAASLWSCPHGPSRCGILSLQAGSAQLFPLCLWCWNERLRGHQVLRSTRRYSELLGGKHRRRAVKWNGRITIITVVIIILSWVPLGGGPIICQAQDWRLYEFRILSSGPCRSHTPNKTEASSGRELVRTWPVWIGPLQHSSARGPWGDVATVARTFRCFKRDPKSAFFFDSSFWKLLAVTFLKYEIIVSK